MPRKLNILIGLYVSSHRQFCQLMSIECMSMDTCNGGSDRQGNGAEAQEEPDGLRGSRGSHNFESYRSQE